MSVDTIVHRLFAQGERHGSEPAFSERVSSASGGAWKQTTYRAYADQVRQAAKSLIALGVPHGGSTCILGKNRPEWVVMAVGTMAVGGASAGIYTTSSPSEVRYIVDHTESKLVLVEDAGQLEKILKEREGMPHLQRIVLMRGAESAKPAGDAGRDVLTWAEFMDAGRDVANDAFDQRLAALEPEGLAVLIYTSGTTGPPKGVMLSHRALVFVADLAAKQAQGKPGDCSISYLPLSHIAEQVFTIHGPITMASHVYFAESLDKLGEHLKDVQPHFFFGVPRVWEKFHAGITAKLRDAKGVKKALVGWAQGVGTAMTAHRCEGTQPSPLLLLQYKLATKLVFAKLKPAIGLGRATFCVSGAAPIAKEVLDLFASLDILVLEVYGQSEDCGPTSFNLPGRAKLGTVGPAVDGVEVKIAEDGEILVRGPNLFSGYAKEPEATAETLVDGWLHSGDLGSFDSKGFLSITGRKKEILITAGGKNIAPKNIEAAFKNHPLVGEAVVIGDRRKFLSCLVTLDPDAAAKFASERGISGALHESAEVRAELQRALDGVNAELARVEQVKKFVVLAKPLSIEGGELTPTLKVKRKIVNEKYSDQIEAMYAE
jgi:long-chain acyl-CoA synthetase